jgi:hypothetical protein
MTLTASILAVDYPTTHKALLKGGHYDRPSLLNGYCGLPRLTFAHLLQSI